MTVHPRNKHLLSKLCERRVIHYIFFVLKISCPIYKVYPKQKRMPLLPLTQKKTLFSFLTLLINKNYSAIGVRFFEGIMMKWKEASFNYQFH
ncbi:hypothetical protein DXU93_06500 [Brumimicrobium aurantiacum]|uniref:Uncharacterized protein n=1 Tax=Brumimicrobium aurantiacum TaxID=1737063 RepID=A0A3E1EYL2_9FLAO|nr:hypothetical protein DXU93_06500 [Brumimicrobium aurantiacum]